MNTLSRFHLAYHSYELILIVPKDVIWGVFSEISVGIKALFNNAISVQSMRTAIKVVLEYP